MKILTKDDVALLFPIRRISRRRLALGGESQATIKLIKEAVRQRDGQVCTRCGRSKEDHLRMYGRNLHVHRVIAGSVYTLTGCVTLCYQCHSFEDGKSHREGLARFHREKKGGVLFRRASIQS